MNQLLGAAVPAIRVGGWHLVPSACRLVRDDTEIKLSPRNTDVLVYLAERAGQIVTHDELLAAFWRGPFSSTNAVHKSVAELRLALGNGGETRYIETVPKRGYRLTVPVEIDVGWAQRPLRLVDSGEPAPSDPAAADSRTRGRGALAGLSRRALPIGALLTTMLALTVAWVTLSDRMRAVPIVTLAERSAALTAAATGGESTQQLVESILEFAEKRIGTKGATVRMQQMPEPGSNPASVWGVDYVVHVAVTESGDRLTASLRLLPDESARLSHREYLDGMRDDRAAFVATVGEHLAEDLAVLLSDDNVQEMAAWGTRNVHAYRLAREADQFQRIETVDSLNRAIDLFRAAIGEDPGFPYGYVSLAAAYSTLVYSPRDNAVRENARRELQALRRDAGMALHDSAELALIEDAYREASVGNGFDQIALRRAAVASNPDDLGALIGYAELLIGAQLLAEGEGYLDRVLALAREAGDDGAIEAVSGERVTIADIRGEFDAADRGAKRLLEFRPEFKLPLWGLVKRLAVRGRYTEAEAYLVRLETADPEWGYNARLLFRAFHGELPIGSARLQEALSNPLASNATRGEVCFVLGDVECGVRYWRDLEAAYLPLIWTFLSSMEVFYADGVVEDPRYQALLDELGVGQDWRACVRRTVVGLEPLTGIGLVQLAGSDETQAISASPDCWSSVN